MVNVLGIGLPEGSEITTGQITIARASSRAQLSAASVPLRGGVFLRTKDVVVGDDEYFHIGKSDVTDTDGIVCTEHVPVWIEANDLSDIWVKSNTNSRTITYMAF